MTSKTIRKLGTLADLSKRLGTDRDGVMAWAKEEARLETLKYKSKTEDAVVMIPFHSNQLMDYNRQKLLVLTQSKRFRGGCIKKETCRFRCFLFLFILHIY